MLRGMRARESCRMIEVLPMMCMCVYVCACVCVCVFVCVCVRVCVNDRSLTYDMHACV